MRKILVLVLVLLASPAGAGNLCGGGIICIEQNTSFTHATAPNPATLTIFTCPSTTNGCLVSAIFVFGNMTLASNQDFFFSQVQGGTVVRMWLATAQPATSLNAMVNNIYPPPPLPYSPVDANGNPVIFMSPGNSLTATSSAAIPASGSGAGSIDIMVYAQQF